MRLATTSWSLFRLRNREQKPPNERRPTDPGDLSFIDAKPTQERFVRRGNYLDFDDLLTGESQVLPNFLCRRHGLGGARGSGDVKRCRRGRLCVFGQPESDLFG